MSDNPILLEWDEDGLHLTLDLDLIEDVNTLGTRFVPDGEGIIRGRLSTSGALDLYEHVHKVLGAWYSEAASARSAVAAGVTLAEYVVGDILDQGLDPLDPKHPGYADNLRDLGDISRKAEREDRP